MSTKTKTKKPAKPRTPRTPKMSQSAARAEGAAKLKARLEQLAGRHGPRFNPRPGWDALIAG